MASRIVAMWALLDTVLFYLLEPFAIVGEAVIWAVVEAPFLLYRLCARSYSAVRTHPRGIKGAALDLGVRAAVAGRHQVAQVRKRPQKLCCSRHLFGLGLLLAMALSPMVMLAVLHNDKIDSAISSRQRRDAARATGGHYSLYYYGSDAAATVRQGNFDSHGNWVVPPPPRDPRDLEEEGGNWGPLYRWFRIWKDLWRRWWYGGAGEVVCAALLVEPRVKKLFDFVDWNTGWRAFLTY